MAAPHVVLVGLMGSGKTTVGRALARELGRPFRDNDVELERREHATAAALQSTRGADALHALEAQILVEQLQTDIPSVVAAAASTVTDADARRMMHERATVVWLRAEVPTLARRVRRSTFRPIDADPTDTIARQERERLALLRQVADVEVDSGTTTATATTAAVVRALRSLEASRAGRPRSEVPTISRGAGSPTPRAGAPRHLG